MKVGDIVQRIMPEGYCARSGESPTGLIIKLHQRSLEHYSQERVDKEPIRMITVLQGNGKMKRWYARHAEVISENR